MGNLSMMGPTDFTKDNHKEGYKELGWAELRIAIQKGIYCITDPYEWENLYQYGADADGECILWKENEPIAEFKSMDHAMIFLAMLVEGKMS